MGGARAAGIAAAVGFAVMGVELTAVRIMAPHFGDSAFVWTNVIGVILVALALGAFLGGRAAAGGDRSRRLSTVLCVGGVWVAIVPWLVDPAGNWLVPNDLALDAAMAALIRGSLAASTLLFAPAVLFAGMATPLLVTALVVEGRPVGESSGRIAAWSTLGSLAGTFATTHVLVPGIGSRFTMFACAALLVGAGCLARFGAGRALAVLPVLLGLAIPVGFRVPPRTGEHVLAEVESSLQYLRVVRDGATDRVGSTTRLQINEGLDSFHSVAIDGQAFTDGRYYDWFAAVPYLRTDGAAVEQLDVLSIGAAAGTFERLLSACFPGARFDSVELDPTVIALAEDYFGGFPESAQVFAGIDGRVFVEHVARHYDLVIVDAYERQIYIPTQVSSREFFEVVRARLKPGGVVALNVGGRTFGDAVVNVVGSTVAEVFGEAAIFRVPRSRNFIVVGRAGASPDPSALGRVRVDSDPDLAAVVARAAQRSSWRRVVTTEPVLVDDRPFLDRLQEQSLERSLQHPELLAIRGESEPSEAEARAYEA
ncbi:MAG: fused MFS/spermidine synthase, partial [Planctomycetes bacterium]|nr:fused MFS/spermidine synthase [Planctomycetota bacterium]